MRPPAPVRASAVLKRRVRRGASLALLALAVLAPSLPASVSAAGDRLLGVLEWRGYAQSYTWRMEWEPIARLGAGGWESLPGDRHPAVDTLWAPPGWGRFLPEFWSSTSWACDTIAVAVGRWEPNLLPEGTLLEDPIPATAPDPWPLWELSDPAAVWHTAGRPSELGEALSGLTRRARELVADRLPPGLEIDPGVPWVREDLRLAEPLPDGGLELVGRFRAAVRLRGGGASSSAIVHFWVSASGGRRTFRALLLDLPEAGAARSSREVIAVLRHPDTAGPVLLIREISAAGRRYDLLGLGAGGVFAPVHQTPWQGCD